MTPPTPPAGARLTDEQIADLLGRVEDDAAVDLTVSNRLDTQQLITALRECLAHRAIARVSGGEAVEQRGTASLRPCEAFVEASIPEYCRTCNWSFESHLAVPQPAAQEVAPLRAKLTAMSQAFMARADWDSAATINEIRDIAESLVVLITGEEDVSREWAEFDRRILAALQRSREGAQK